MKLQINAKVIQNIFGNTLNQKKINKDPIGDLKSTEAQTTLVIRYWLPHMITKLRYYVTFF